MDAVQLLWSQFSRELQIFVFSLVWREVADRLEVTT